MRIQQNGKSITLWASAKDTYNWAHKSGSSWPCSQLSGKRFVATFDDGDLVDLVVDGKTGADNLDIDANEFDAICRDLLQA